MNRFFSFIMAIAIFFPATAFADPGSEPWVTFSQSTTAAQVGHISGGSGALLVINAGDTNSALLHVNSSNAYVCFDPDIAAASTGAARVTMKLALSAVPADNAAITMPAIPVNGTDCIDIVRGAYWINIDTPASGAEVAHLIVQGR